MVTSVSDWLCPAVGSSPIARPRAPPAISLAQLNIHASPTIASRLGVAYQARPGASQRTGDGGNGQLATGREARSGAGRSVAQGTCRPDARADHPVGDMAGAQTRARHLLDRIAVG